MSIPYWTDDPNLNYTDPYNIGPFKYRDNAGEGGSPGFEVDASGSGIYNMLRPELIPVNDGLSFSLQAVVESTLTLNGGNQGFALQVRGLRITETDITQTWISDPDTDQSIFWYGRQDPGFIFVTNTFKLPKNLGTTHLAIEPMVHAASGNCRITSIRMRTHTEDVLRYSPGATPGINSVSSNIPANASSHYYSPYSETVDIKKNQELSFDLSNANDRIVTTLQTAVGAEGYFVAAVDLQNLAGNYERKNLLTQYVKTTGAATPVEFTRTILAEKPYQQVRLIFGVSESGIEGGPNVGDGVDTFSGLLTIENIDFRMGLKDIVISGN